MMRKLGLLGLLFWASAVQAEPPGQTLRPVARPTTSVDVAQSIITQITPQLLSNQAGRTTLRPVARPASVVNAARTSRRLRRKGAVCNDLDLQGELVGRVPGKLNGCGVSDAIRLRSVSGVTLSHPATLDCTTAKALKQWVDKGLKPSIGRYGGGPSSMRVMASYSCRTRNSKPGAKISEHGRGRAIDIGGITLKNGETISVLSNWNDRKKGKILRKMHSAACGPFGTVLGPESDRHHKDHFHFDTARYRSGPYCR